MPDDSALSTRRPNEPFGPVKRRKFLEAYRQSSNIRASCEHANIDRQTYYNAIQSDPDFAAQVQVAEQEAIDRLEAKAWNNALVKDSETSLWNLLKAHRPKKYVPVTKVAETDSEGNDLPAGVNTDAELIDKTIGIIARAAPDALRGLLQLAGDSSKTEPEDTAG